jgi:serine/threonine-protein kinase
MHDDESSDGLLGWDIVYSRVVSDAGTFGSAHEILPTMSENRVLGLVDGQRTVADILRLSPLASQQTLEHLRSLRERGQLVRRDDRGPAPGGFRGGGANVIVIDTRGRARGDAAAPTSVAASPVAPAAPRANVIVIDTRRRDSAPVPTLGAAARATSVVASLPPEAAAPPPVAAGSTSPGSKGSGLFRLGSYEVVMRLGQGGMGTIYVCSKAELNGAQRLYTLKVVRQHSDQQDLAEQSLRREGRVGAWLRHPNVQSVVENGMYKDQPFLILEYIEGVSLAELLARGRRPPPAVVVSVVLDVLRGLARTHGLRDDAGRALGVVHCDVSPPNILVGSDGVSRLTDFGSCCILSEESPSRAEPLRHGKASYMAPEQLCAEPLDGRTDLFALGAVMYAALTGQDLFAAESYDEIVLNVLRRRIPPASEHGAPPCLDEICRRALTRAREGRYASAGEMADALVKTASAHGLLASPGEVADFVRQDFGEVLDERRRRIQSALDGTPAARVSAWDMPVVVDAGQRRVDAGQRRVATPAVPGASALEDITPATPDLGARASGARKADVRTRDVSPAPRGSMVRRAAEAWRWIVEERRVIAFSIAVGTALIAVTVLLNRSSPAAPRPRSAVATPAAPAVDRPSPPASIAP